MAQENEKQENNINVAFAEKKLIVEMIWLCKVQLLMGKDGAIAISVCLA